MEVAYSQPPWLTGSYHPRHEQRCVPARRVGDGVCDDELQVGVAAKAIPRRPVSSVWIIVNGLYRTAWK